MRHVLCLRLPESFPSRIEIMVINIEPANAGSVPFTPDEKH